MRVNQILSIFFCFLLVISPCFGAFGAATAWDVKTTGVDTNGGAFDGGVGVPGTDESQGAGTAITVTAATTTGTGSPAFSSTTHGPGNFIHIASGTGCNTGWFEILSQSAGTATFDRSMGTGSCVGVIGGSLLTIQQANTNAVASNVVYCSGTFTFTSSLPVSQSTMSFIGYGSTHLDGTRCAWTTATNSTTLINTGSSNAGVQLFKNLALSNTAGTSASAIWQLSAHGSTQQWMLVNDSFTGFVNCVDSSNGAPDDVAYITVLNSDFAGCSGAAITGSSNVINLIAQGNYFHAGGTSAITNGGNSTGIFSLEGNILSGNGMGVLWAGFYTSINNNVFYKDTTTVALSIGCSSCLAYAFNNNAFYGNSSPPISLSALATNGRLQINLAGMNNAFDNFTGQVIYVGNSSNITLTADPFTNGSGGVFTLNSTAGGGPLLKATGAPLVYGSSTTNGLNVGAVQSSCIASGGGGACAFSMLKIPKPEAVQQ